MVAYVAGQFYETLIERTAARALVGRVADELAAVRRDDDGDLLDRSYQLALMRWREDHLTASLARRLKRGVDAGNDPYKVFKNCQDHAATLAGAHTDRIVLEAFDDAIQRCPNPRVAEILNVACDLQALSTIERDRGWFLEHGRISSTRSKAITRAVNRLCAQARDHADVLVDAFGIPDPILDAPIAKRCA
jgi:acyl-CoA oxidase